MNKNYPYNLLRDLKIPKDEAIDFSTDDLTKRVEYFLENHATRAEAYTIRGFYKYKYFSDEEISKNTGINRGHVAEIRYRVLKRMSNSSLFRRSKKITW